MVEGLKSPPRSGGEREEVYEAYLGQFERDLKSFLKCRALEMVEGGIMSLLIPECLLIGTHKKSLPMCLWPNFSDLPSSI